MTDLNPNLFRRLVATAALLGLGVRIAWSVWATRTPTGLFDPARYLGYGQRIADGHGYVEFTGHPTAYYPPGYPYFVGIVTWVSRPFTHDATRAVVAVQVLLGAVTVVLVAYVARRLAGRLAGVLAAFAYALYPNLVMHTGVLLGETLNIFFTMAFLALLLAKPLGSGISVRRGVAAGALVGLALLVRPITAALVPVVIGCWWLARRDARDVARASAALLAGTALLVGPWVVRNGIRMGEFVPMSTNTGDNLCIGYRPGATGVFSFDDHCAIGDPFTGPSAEVAVDRAKTRYALRQVREDPGRVPGLIWKHVYFTWIYGGDHDIVGVAQNFYTDAWMAPRTRDRIIRTADAAYWTVVVTGAAGLALLVRRRRPEDLLLVGSFAMTAIVPFAFFGDARFKAPAIPMLIVAGAVAVSRVASLRRRAVASEGDS